MKQFEGFARLLPDGRVEAYPDPGTGGEPWTIGWGSTGIDPFNGGRIRRGTIWTREQADMRFREHLAEFERAVNSGIKVPTTQNQFDAMVSLTYNIGAQALRRSTLLSHHNARRFNDAANEFLRWNRAGGRVMAGLTRRREAERRLYLS
ncbi:MAG: lysozyme [Erythrobacter sp.]